jgi:hypothetical protein
MLGKNFILQYIPACRVNINGEGVRNRVGLFLRDNGNREMHYNEFNPKDIVV